MKRFFCILLAMILLLLSFNSCKKEDEEGGATTTTTTVATCAQCTYGEWTIETRPNCGVDGLRVRICSVCQNRQEEPIAATNLHKYSGISCTTCEKERVYVNEVPFSKFVIVSANDSYCVDAANNLKEKIEFNWKYSVPIKDSTAAESEYEIIIGNVSRDFTNDFYTQSEDKQTGFYDFLVTENKMIFSAGDEKAMNKLIERFLKRYVVAINCADFAEGDNFYGNTYVDGKDELSDIRIMSNNIYFHEFSQERVELLLKSFEVMDADILLLQEVSSEWHNAIDDDLVERGYTQVSAQFPATTGYKSFSWTPIWYNANIVTLKDSGHKFYDTCNLIPDAHLSFSKSYTWAVFEDNATGKEFACISTHFTWAPSDFVPSADECKLRDAKEARQKIEDLKNTYGEDFPILLAGDLNCTVGHAPYNELMKEMKDIRLSGNVKKSIDTSYETCHPLGSAPTGTYVIDHTLFSGKGMIFKRYQHVINYYAYSSTDHVPLLLDIAFAK